MVPSKFLPKAKKEIDVPWAASMYTYANHVSKSFSTSDSPSQETLQEWRAELIKIHGYTGNVLHQEFLAHLQSLSREYGVVVGGDLCQGKQIRQIHKAVLRSNDNECILVYLKRVLAFLKIPQKRDLSWVRSAQRKVMEQYDIIFPISAETNFVEDMASYMFNNQCNQRLRRGTWKSRKTVYYERVPAEVKEKGTYENVTVIVEPVEIEIGLHVMKGNLIRRLPGASGVQLKKAAAINSSYVEYMKEAEKIWKREMVRAHCSDIYVLVPYLKYLFHNMFCILIINRKKGMEKLIRGKCCQNRRQSFSNQTLVQLMFQQEQNMSQQGWIWSLTLRRRLLPKATLSPLPTKEVGPRILMMP